MDPVWLIALSNRVERVIRIELTYQAWEARVLPLNYTRVENFGLWSAEVGLASAGTVIAMR